MKLFLLLFFCHLSSPVKHSVKYRFTSSLGIDTFPTLVAVGLVDEVEIMYCDSNTKVIKPKPVWMEKIFEDEPDQVVLLSQVCATFGEIFKDEIADIMLHLNQSDGVHVFQRLCGCELDNETGEVDSFMWYGYDGENFLKFDIKTGIWISAKPQAEFSKHKWDKDTARNRFWKNHFTNVCPQWLKKYLSYGRNTLLRTELPSVSLLQKNPSAPVSCHATGFFPNRAMMFWRKDGVEFHQGIEIGEILPNHDGTFQMTINLKHSSNTTEDWRRYECVFQLVGVDDIITGLEKAIIRTNFGSPTEFPVGAIIGIVVSLLLLGVCIAGFFICRRRNDGFQPANNGTEGSAGGALSM